MEDIIKAVEDAIATTKGYPDKKQLENLKYSLEDLNLANKESIAKCLKTPLPLKKPQASTGSGTTTPKE